MFKILFLKSIYSLIELFTSDVFNFEFDCSIVNKNKCNVSIKDNIILLNLKWNDKSFFE